jgi:hypothetical protein
VSEIDQTEPPGQEQAAHLHSIHCFIGGRTASATRERPRSSSCHCASEVGLLVHGFCCRKAVPFFFLLPYPPLVVFFLPFSLVEKGEGREAAAR